MYKKIDYVSDFYTEAAIKLHEALAELELFCIYVNSDACNNHRLLYRLE